MRCRPLRTLPLLRRRRPLPAGNGRRRVSRRAYLNDPPRPGGRGGLYRPLELSPDDGGLEAGPGAGGRQLCGDKPSEITPLTALKLAELAKDIFPEGVINVLLGRGKTVGDPLTAHAKVRMVSLTGSIATGAHIIRPYRLVD